MRIALLSTSDTDLLSARASGADYVLANPARARPALPVRRRVPTSVIVPAARRTPGPGRVVRRPPRHRASRWSCSEASSSPTPS